MAVSVSPKFPTWPFYFFIGVNNAITAARGIKRLLPIFTLGKRPSLNSLKMFDFGKRDAAMISETVVICGRPFWPLDAICRTVIRPHGCRIGANREGGEDFFTEGKTGRN